MNPSHSKNAFRILFPGAHTSEPQFRAACALGLKGTIVPLVIGRREDFMTTALALGVEMIGAEAIWPVDHPALEDLVDWFLSRSLDGLTPDHARARILSNYVLFSTGLIATDRAEAIVLPSHSTTPAGLSPQAVITFPPDADSHRIQTSVEAWEPVG